MKLSQIMSILEDAYANHHEERKMLFGSKEICLDKFSAGPEIGRYRKAKKRGRDIRAPFLLF